MTSLTTSPSEENYLEHIYRLARSGPVRPASLSDRLGVSRPSVTRAIGGLARKGLVDHEPYGRIELTADGRALARAIVRRDECLTRLLVDLLGMSPEAADPEVHRLEHLLSDEVLVRLEALVALAAESEAWQRRLRHRIGQALEREPATARYLAGRWEVHSGQAREKRGATDADRGREV